MSTINGHVIPNAHPDNVTPSAKPLSVVATAKAKCEAALIKDANTRKEARDTPRLPPVAKQPQNHGTSHVKADSDIEPVTTREAA
mmetsp:Transcript_3092/g.6807  ORF Transcript_3092/g.6807 Transcript_3092/m.6807 type:complete len:85 (+) Transcript_3092:351-605(+)